ncbi:hypothetical protein PAHAL_5G374100 [Panicum hallii]|uniref:Uncharacterized protein n=1 Tax=Panicum hallii TaxID=206008 RepID=A0A2T8IMG5_9POAL|nr:hypothetical protein PAHAL_5G374100 [Panicum hallii]
MHAHEGIKVCDLYMVNENSTSDSDDGNDAQGNNAGLASTERLKAFINGSERLTSDTELRMKRARDSSSCSDVSWQPKKHHPDSSNDD